jgi:general secretion pathway protein E
MTIEDPIEYGFRGINQIQVNRQAKITFPVGLRAIMRHDPDIILVGEIRDAETASTAIQAAITGHLVLTSIHANDAVSALLRLIDMGVEPFLVSSAVIGSLSQRLVRRVCSYCGQQAEISAPEAAAYQAEMGEGKKRFLVGRGCNFCARSGFLGRVGAFEQVTVNDDIRKMLVQGTPASAGAGHARQHPPRRSGLRGHGAHPDRRHAEGQGWGDDRRRGRAQRVHGPVAFAVPAAFALIPRHPFRHH